MRMPRSAKAFTVSSIAAAVFQPNSSPAATSYFAAERAILGVDAAAGPDEIRAAHRRLVSALHPNAVQSTYEYDGRDRLTSVRHASGGTTIRSMASSTPSTSAGHARRP